MANLYALLDQAFHANPKDVLISPIGEHCYATLLGVVPDVIAVMRTAAEIEGRPDEVMAWFTATPIRELGSLTAERLIEMGRAEAVIDFLRSVRDGVRD